MTRRLSPSWLTHRQGLHRRLRALSPSPDLVRLAFELGPAETWPVETVAAAWRRAGQESRATWCAVEIEAAVPTREWRAQVLGAVRDLAPALDWASFQGLAIHGPSASELGETVREIRRYLRFDTGVALEVVPEPMALRGVRDTGAGLEAVSVVGLGPGSLSRIFARATLRAAGPDQPPGYVGRLRSVADECVAWLLGALQAVEQVPIDALKHRFGPGAVEAIAPALAVWADGGDRASVRPPPGPERLESLLWLIPDAQLEHEVARLSGLDLDADALLALLAPLSPNAPVAPGVVFEGVARAQVELRVQGQVLRLRVAPGPEPESAPRLVITARPPPGAEQAVAVAVGRLQRRIARNTGR